MFARTLFLAVLGAASWGAARAETVEVKLVNQGADGFMAFEPSLVKINPGDSVHFVAADKGHNAETIKGMAPEGTTPFKGELSKDVTATFDKPGVYGVKCAPHFAMGMTALVAVGDTYPNLDAAKAMATNGQAKKRLDANFAKLGK